MPPSFSPVCIPVLGAGVDVVVVALVSTLTSADPSVTTNGTAPAAGGSGAAVASTTTRAPRALMHSPSYGTTDVSSLVDEERVDGRAAAHRRLVDVLVRAV